VAVDRVLSGFVSGLAATAPMTAAMVAMHRKLPGHHRYALPPRRITMRVAEKLGVKHHLDEGHRTGLTLLAHFGYGAAVGTLFGLVAPRRPSRAIPAGVGYGLLVWAGSYLGILPTMNLHRSARREPHERNLLMIAAHVVWGAAIGALAPLLRSDNRA
jgi:putative membrane protein